jgi:hypothetical protein
MTDPRQHVRPGQRLRLAAAQVNFVNDLMARRPQDPRVENAGLPLTVTPVEVIGTGGEIYGGGAFGEVAIPKSLTNNRTSATPAVPFDLLTHRTFSNREKLLPKQSSLYVEVANPATGSPHDPFVICVGNCWVSEESGLKNGSGVWGSSGFAWTRVRVFNNAHRFARAPSPFPGQTEEQAANGVGCLDSCFYGPARILGYLTTTGYWADSDFRNANWTPEYGFSETAAMEYPSHEFRWAWVQF